MDLYRDVRVSDDYRWLEDWNDPAVKAWSESESAFARRALDAIPLRAGVHARLETLMSESSPSWSSLVARKGTFFALEDKPPKQHPSLIVLTATSDLKSERTLVDPSTLDTTGGTSIGWFVPSPDGKRVAVSLSKGGGERGDVHVYDVASGKEAKDVVPQADGAGNGACLAWKGDGSGFYYTHAAREPDVSKDGVYQRIYFHKLGDPTEKDALAVGKDAPSIAQWEVVLGGDGRSILARMEYGDGSEYDQWLLGPSGKWSLVATKADDVKAMDVGPDGRLYLLSAKGAPRHRLLRTSLTSPSLDKAGGDRARRRRCHRGLRPAEIAGLPRRDRRRAVAHPERPAREGKAGDPARW